MGDGLPKVWEKSRIKKTGFFLNAFWHMNVICFCNGTQIINFVSIHFSGIDIRICFIYFRFDDFFQLPAGRGRLQFPLLPFHAAFLEIPDTLYLYTILNGVYR